MSVTQYTIPCKYNIPKLKDTVFFLSKNSLKTITIDNGEAYATFVNPSPYPPSPNRLKGFNVKLTETESLDERYKFTKQLTMSIHGHLTDSQFLMDDNFYIVVQTEDGTYYLVNVDFPSKMTYTYNLSNGQNQTDFTFTNNSNHPTLKLNWNPATWNTCQTYQVYGIDGLKLLEKDYTTIDVEQGVINLFDGNEFKQVDYLKNTISLQESYDGEVTTTTISFEIPFSNYKPSWQYNLLEFDQNLYVAHITPKNSTNGIFCGYEHGLQPQYELNGSASNGESTTIKITLVEASEWGIFEFDTWSYYRDSSKRWIGVDSEHICVEFGVGVYLLMQEVDGNGTPTGRYKCLEGYESQYTNYNIVGTYEEAPRFTSSDCARSMARRVNSDTYYTCVDGDKYSIKFEEISYDNMKSWVRNGEYELGDMVESGSSWCEIEPQYKWKLTNEWVCKPQMERWIPSGTTCVGVDKCQNNYKQVSDDGVNWTNSNPLEWSATTVIEYNSEDCGYFPPITEKFLLTLNDSSVVTGACDETSAITSGEVSTQYSGTVVSATIGDCVSLINRNTFLYCSSLTSVTIGNNVEEITYWAFSGCTSLTSVVIPSNVKRISGGWAFGGCYALTSVTIEEGVESIGSLAFSNCTGLTSVDIPSSVTDIYTGPFNGCSSLTSITCHPLTPPNMYGSGNVHFVNTNNCPIYVPTSSVNAYKSAYGWSDVADRIYPIPPSPTGYTQVEYVENSTLAYLDSGFKPNQDTRIVAEMQCVTSTSYNQHFGCGGWNVYNGIRMGYESGISGTLHVKYGTNNGWTVYSNITGDLNKHTYDWNKNQFYMDNSLVGSTTYGNYQATDNLGIFFVVEGSVTPTSEAVFKGRVYSFKIYDDGVLVRDLVPCKRDSDNMVGMYDLVNGVFFYPPNYQSYQLIAGPVVS